MLQAICHSKAGRVATADTSCPDAESISWRKLFRTREDLLTAMFFGRLAYLSDKTLNHVMALLLNAEAADELGCWQGIDYWPSLRRKSGQRVEPDVLMRFENALVLVEVKPPAGNDQSCAQWRRQLQALSWSLRPEAGRTEPQEAQDTRDSEGAGDCEGAEDSEAFDAFDDTDTVDDADRADDADMADEPQNALPSLRSATGQFRARVEFLALGRNGAITTGDVQRLRDELSPQLQFAWRLHQQEWRDLLEGLIRLQDQLKAQPGIPRSDLAVLHDWQQGLQLYGLWPAPHLHFAQLQQWWQQQTQPDEALPPLQSALRDDQPSWRSLMQWGMQPAPATVSTPTPDPTHHEL